jgi:hypothetical protein
VVTEMQHAATQLAMLLPNVPKLHVVLICPAEAAVGEGGGGRRGGPTLSATGHAARPQDHALNFVNLQGGQGGGGGGGGEAGVGGQGGGGGAGQLDRGRRSPRKKRAGGGGGRLQFEVFAGFYDDYVFSAGPGYVAPSLVVAPHLGLPNEWVPSVVSLLQKFAPVCWTLWTERECVLVAHVLDQVLDAAIVDGCNGKEPFASKLGHVDTQQVRVLFDNCYSITVRGFKQEPPRGGVKRL